MFMFILCLFCTFVMLTKQKISNNKNEISNFGLTYCMSKIFSNWSIWISVLPVSFYILLVYLKCVSWSFFVSSVFIFLYSFFLVYNTVKKEYCDISYTLFVIILLQTVAPNMYIKCKLLLQNGIFRKCRHGIQSSISRY